MRALLFLALAVVAACGPGTTTSSGAGGDATGGGGSTSATGGQGPGGSTGTGGQGGHGGSNGQGGDGGSGGQPPAQRVRVVAANLSSGNLQSYDPGHGLRILQGLDADVVLLQEMNYGNDSSAAFETMVATVCGGGCDYVRGPQEQIPNGVVSRLPILDGGSWTDPQVSNRTFVWARFDAPGNDDLWAISVHLLSSGATQRNLEAQALLSQIASQVPTSDLIVLGGDLNTDSRGETVIGTLGSVFHTAGPHPADQNGNDMTNEPRSRPYDWVLADDDLAPHLVPVVIGSSTFPSGAVIDTRVYTPLAEIAPAQQGDSGAPGMQHMAVVKDFVLP